MTRLHLSVGAIRRRLRDISARMIRRHYYDRGWVPAGRQYEQAVTEALGGAGRLLDIGCGRTFPNAGIWRELGADVFGLDPIWDDAAEAVDGADVRKGLADAIPHDDDFFDVVVCRSVLEHLEYPAAAFREMARVLKPGGKLVFLAPSRWDYVSVISRLTPNGLHGLIIRTLEGRDEEDTFDTFYRANSHRQIRALAAASGLVVRRLENPNHFPYLFMDCPPLCGVMIAYDQLLGRMPRLREARAWLLGVLEKM